MCVFLPRVVVLKSASENVVCLWIKSSGTFLFFKMEKSTFFDDEKIFFKEIVHFKWSVFLLLDVFIFIIQRARE